MLNYYSGQENEKSWNRMQRKSGPFAPIVVSMVGVLMWLMFILFFALYWSKSYSLFQNIVVFVVSLCITGLLLGLMWIIWGRNKIHTWTNQY
ncbi:MAG TPA: hypothetical protein VEF91_07205 [Verrucomicrobiae bacterium]|nr:hypothetical protein [Verrucomicrobiae bacterium]